MMGRGTIWLTIRLRGWIALVSSVFRLFVTELKYFEIWVCCSNSTFHYFYSPVHQDSNGAPADAVVTIKKRNKLPLWIKTINPHHQESKNIIIHTIDHTSRRHRRRRTWTLNSTITADFHRIPIPTFHICSMPIMLVNWTVLWEMGCWVIIMVIIMAIMVDSMVLGMIVHNSIMKFIGRSRFLSWFTYFILKVGRSIKHKHFILNANAHIEVFTLLIIICRLVEVCHCKETLVGRILFLPT